MTQYLVMCGCGHGQQEEVEHPTHYSWKCEGCGRTNSFLVVEVNHKHDPSSADGQFFVRYRRGADGRNYLDYVYQGNAQDKFGWE